MAFMDFFNAKPQQNSQQQQGSQQNGNQPQNPGGNNPNMPQPNNGNQPPNNGQGNNPNGQQGNQNAQNQTPANPMDAYKGIWDNPNTQANTPPAFNIDPKIMDQVVSSQDFMKGIDPEVMQKATQGDMQAMMEIMHGVARNSYRASIEHGGMLTDKFVGAREEFSGKSLPSKVRKELTGQALSNTPNYQHPVVRKQLTEIADRFQQQHPDATPGEIAEMSKKYLNDLVSAMNPADPNASEKNKSNEPRGAEFWDKFFDEEPDQT